MKDLLDALAWMVYQHCCSDGVIDSYALGANETAIEILEENGYISDGWWTSKSPVGEAR